MSDSPYDPHHLMLRIRTLKSAAEQSDPSLRMAYLSEAAQCERLLERSLSTPVIADADGRNG